MRTLRRLFPFIARYKTRLIWGLVAITVSNVFSVAIPRVIGGMVDSIGSGSITATGLARDAGIIILLSIGSGIFLFLTRQTIIVMSRKIEFDLRNHFLSHVQSLPMSYFNVTPTGDVMALATNDISAVREFVGPALMYSANTLTTFGFALVMMLTLSVKITLLALIPLPLVSITVYYIGSRIHTLFGQVQGQYADLTSVAQENLSGVRVVRAYVREKFGVGVFRDLSLVYRDRNMELVRIQGLMMPLMTVLIGISLAIVLGVGGYEVSQGRATIGVIVQFFAYIGQLIWPVIAIGWVTNLVQRASASMDRLTRVFDRSNEVAAEENVDTSISAITGTIEFRNVSFRYGETLPYVLREISFTAVPGTTTAIVGNTGAGKSTIVNLIARLYDITDGALLIDGVPVNRIPLDVLRGSIGTVTQETFLFSDTIAGNIRFGRPDASMEDVVEAARIAQLDDNVQGFPKGYETIVGERGITLSGGQKQRTSIARAVLRRPEILMLDDALSAVDTETEEKILDGLRTVMKQRTSIVIAHRISTVKDADLILVLDQGHVAERGTHEELLRHRGIYAAMYERQLLEEQLENL